MPKVISLYFYADKEVVPTKLEFGSNYNMALMSGVALEARRCGYSVNVDIITSDMDRNAIVSRVLDSFRSRQTGTAVFVGLNSTCNFINDIIDTGLNHHVIVLDKHISTENGARCILSGDRASAVRACEYMKSQGYERVMHVTGDVRKLSGAERRNGYMQFISGEDYEPYVLNGDYSYRSGYMTAERYINDKAYEQYDAILFGSDIMAHGFIDRLLETHSHIIPVTGMVGFDNDPLDLYKRPRLSSMAMDFSNMAHIIMSLEENYEQYSGGITMQIDHQLIKRDTTKTKEERLQEAEALKMGRASGLSSEFSSESGPFGFSGSEKGESV